MRRIHSFLFAFAAFLSFALFAHSEAAAARKLALVIGNDTYTNVAPLQRAVADARAYKDVLENERGFEVFYVENAGRAETYQTIYSFLGQIQPGDVTMVVYAGHGVQLDPERRDTLFLLPTDIPNVDPGLGAEELFFNASGISFSQLASQIEARGAGLRLFVLDACRDNPFANRGTGRAIGVSRGIGAISSGNGEFIFYSAGPGQQALDRLPTGDDSPNSVFTRVFLEHFKEGAYLEDIANDVQARVLELASLARFEQTPYYSDGVPGKTCLDAECGRGVEIVKVDPGAGTVDPVIEQSYWEQCASHESVALCQAYLDAFPEGAYAILVAARIQVLKESIEPDPGNGGIDPVTGGVLPTPAPDPGTGTEPGGETGGETGRGGDTGTVIDIGDEIAATWKGLQDSYDMAALKEFAAAHPGTGEATAAEARIGFLRDFYARGQRELNRIGYGAGAVDGIWGRKSARALSRFQKAQGLRQTGVLTDELLDRLVAADPLPRRQPDPVRPDPGPELPDPGRTVIPTPIPNGGDVIVIVPTPAPVKPEPTPAPSTGSGGGSNIQLRSGTCDTHGGGAGWENDC